MKKKYILSIDQGTTGSRAILFNHEGEAFTTSYKEIVQHIPYPNVCKGIISKFINPSLTTVIQTNKTYMNKISNLFSSS